ncbi:DUF938 domain-containing protein [Alteromonas sp. CYL-A6]|uniref:DUF938 domain-containing protein n=1 Tax=Alteromonas nitratireducens TaxID=3390813 RepID=UPI0034ACEC01
MTDKPFSQACENNKGPILSHLAREFARTTRVLEIGSGTGQHAVHFAAHLPHLTWQTSDQPHYHAGITAWAEEARLANLRLPLTLTIGEEAIPQAQFDGVFTANTAHIMQKEEVQRLMHDVSTALPDGGVFCQYGPFTQNGVFSSDSNRDFHQSLLERGLGGYRDITELQAWRGKLVLNAIHDMPANNLLLVWKKSG